MDGLFVDSDQAAAEAWKASVAATGPTIDAGFENRLEPADELLNRRGTV